MCSAAGSSSPVRHENRRRRGTHRGNAAPSEMVSASLRPRCCPCCRSPSHPRAAIDSIRSLRQCPVTLGQGHRTGRTPLSGRRRGGSPPGQRGRSAPGKSGPHPAAANLTLNGASVPGFIRSGLGRRVVLFRCALGGRIGLGPKGDTSPFGEPRRPQRRAGNSSSRRSRMRRPLGSGAFTSRRFPPRSLNPNSSR